MAKKKISAVQYPPHEVLEDLTLQEMADRNRMLVKEFRGIKTSGKLQLTFAAATGKSLICGLELVAE